MFKNLYLYCTCMIQTHVYIRIIFLRTGVFGYQQESPYVGIRQRGGFRIERDPPVLRRRNSDRLDRYSVGMRITRAFLVVFGQVRSEFLEHPVIHWLLRPFRIPGFDVNADKMGEKVFSPCILKVCVSGKLYLPGFFSWLDKLDRAHCDASSIYRKWKYDVISGYIDKLGFFIVSKRSFFIVYKFVLRKRILLYRYLKYASELF